MKLIIAEKPAVGRSIANVLGVKGNKEGYIEGSGYIISWCIGHVLGLADAQEYDEKYNSWDRELLPIIPKKYKYTAFKSTKKQLTILKKLLKRSDVNEVVNACDAGREGELIFRLVYNEAKSTLPMKRLWITSMEDQAIKEGLENLKNGKDFDNLYNSSLARSIADWLVGINLTRLYTQLYNQTLIIGRVQTPTLNLIYKRDQEIKNFQKERYYTIDLSLHDLVLSSGKIESEEEGKSILQRLPDVLKIHDVEEREKSTTPDKLYDLTTLQKEANKIFGYKSTDTLNYVQKLYEYKLVTYPRTDSRYLTEDMKEKVDDLLQALDENFKKDAKNTSKIFNSNKVSDHYAIIPTMTGATFNLDDELQNTSGLKLNAKEKNILKLIKNKLLMACSPSLEEKTKKVIVQFEDYEFTAHGKTVLKQGFKIYDEHSESKDVLIPDVSPGDELDVTNKKLLIKYTTPPSSYTEATLLGAMEKAGTEELDKDIEVEREGLGTPATRASMIEALLRNEYITREKKNLKITPKGKLLIDVVEDYFKDPKTTSQWEMKLAKIAEGTNTKEEFLLEIENIIKAIVEYYKDIPNQTGRNGG